MRRPVVSVEQTGMLNGRLHPKREGENNRRGGRRRRHCGLAGRARHRVFVGALMRKSLKVRRGGFTAND